MGLFKIAIVVAVGVSLLPTEREKQTQLYQRAASAATWTMTFCDRNAVTCSNASGLWSEFSKKAEFGAKLALDVIRETETGATQSTKPTSPSPRSVSVQVPALTTGSLHQPVLGTLTRGDLEPAWRGKVAIEARR